MIQVHEDSVFSCLGHRIRDKITIIIITITSNVISYENIIEIHPTVVCKEEECFRWFKSTTMTMMMITPGSTMMTANFSGSTT